MFSRNMIVGSILIATLIGDFVAFKYYPQGGSRVGWTYSKVAGILMKLQNVTHKFADVMFCNNPEQCKNATDEFFAIAADFTQYFVERIKTFALKSDDGIVKRNSNEVKKRIVDYTTEFQHKGDAKKAEMIIKSLRFSSYKESNLCDLKEGIPPAKYEATVDAIAKLTAMPEELKISINQAKDFTGGNVQAVRELNFKTKEGNMVFGRVFVTRRDEVLDMAYSLHSVKYELMKRQAKPENAKNLDWFSKDLGQDENNGEGYEGISLELREDFLTFFHEQAIQGFEINCDYLLKTMKTEGKDAEVLKRLGVPAQ